MQQTGFDWLVASVFRNIAFEPMPPEEMDAILPSTWGKWRETVPRSRMNGYLQVTFNHISPVGPPVTEYDWMAPIVVQQFCDAEEARYYAECYQWGSGQGVGPMTLPSGPEDPRIGPMASSPGGAMQSFFKSFIPILGGGPLMGMPILCMPVPSPSKMKKGKFLGEEAYYFPEGEKKLSAVVIGSFVVTYFTPLLDYDKSMPGNTPTWCPACTREAYLNGHTLHKGFGAVNPQGERYSADSTLAKAGKMHREELEAFGRFIFSRIKSAKPSEGPFASIRKHISEILDELRQSGRQDLYRAAAELYRSEKSDIDALAAKWRLPLNMEELGGLEEELTLLLWQVRVDASISASPPKKRPGYRFVGRRMVKGSLTWAQDASLKNWTKDKVLPDISEKPGVLTELSGGMVLDRGALTEDALSADYYEPE